MENPLSNNNYRELADKLAQIHGHQSHSEEYNNILTQLEDHVLPECYPDTVQVSFLSDRELGMDALVFRDEIIKRSGYALLAYDWIRPLADWIGQRRCLEIMAGSGALSYGLGQCGVDIVATDNKSWGTRESDWFSKPWTKVEQLDAVQAIKLYAKEYAVVICSWPYMDDGAYQALCEMRKVNPGAIMIFIGEPEGGATASSAFYETMQEIEDPLFLAAVERFKQMPGIHDEPILIK